MGEGGLGLMAQVIKDDQDIEKKKKINRSLLFVHVYYFSAQNLAL